MNIFPTIFITKPNTLKLQAFALTDVGQKRAVNEDCVFQFSDRLKDGENVGLYIVCDGMGGQEAGDVASQLVVRTIVSELGHLLVYEDDMAHGIRPFSSVFITDWLHTAIEKANRAIHDWAAKENISKMGTTVTALFIYCQKAYIAHLGDSRAYCWRAGTLTQITSDHTIANELVKAKAISPEAGKQHDMRHVLTRSVSGKKQLESIDIIEKTLRSGDRLLLCSDGLWTAFPDDQTLNERVSDAPSPSELCWQLVGEANQRDGSDNISALAVFID